MVEDAPSPGALSPELRSFAQRRLEEIRQCIQRLKRKLDRRATYGNHRAKYVSETVMEIRYITGPRRGQLQEIRMQRIPGPAVLECVRGRQVGDRPTFFDWINHEECTVEVVRIAPAQPADDVDGERQRLESLLRMSARCRLEVARQLRMDADLARSLRNLATYEARGDASRLADLGLLGARPHDALRGQRYFQWVLDASIPIPADLPRVLLVGPFGSGKSTLMRQLLGTVDSTYGFPATSSARTTIAPTEVICRAIGTFSGVAVFEERSIVERHVADNVRAACRIATDLGASDQSIADALLTHKDQRLRFSLILGAFVDPSQSFRPMAPEQVERQSELQSLINRIRLLCAGLTSNVPSDREWSAFLSSLAQQSEFRAIVGDLLAMILRVVNLATDSGILYDEFGWPVSWSYSSSDRDDFLESLEILTGNAPPTRTHMLGRLLTPLVRGVRVQGPFRPASASEFLPMILCDTQGSHHTDEEGVASATVQEMLESDVVIVTDLGDRPMTLAAYEHLEVCARAGIGPRTCLVFTRVDRVTRAGGFGVLDEVDAVDHVRISLDKALNSLNTTVGKDRARDMRDALSEGRVFYLSDLNVNLNPDNPEHVWTLDQLRDFALLSATRSRSDELASTDTSGGDYLRLLTQWAEVADVPS